MMINENPNRKSQIGHLTVQSYLQTIPLFFVLYMIQNQMYSPHFIFCRSFLVLYNFSTFLHSLKFLLILGLYFLYNFSLWPVLIQLIHFTHLFSCRLCLIVETNCIILLTKFLKKKKLFLVYRLNDLITRSPTL